MSLEADLAEIQNYNLKANILGSSILSLLFVLVYKTTLVWMYNRYMGADSYYSHGFIVPIVSLFLIYQEKENLVQLESKPSSVGLFVLIMALMLHIIGTILYIFAISGFSIFFFIIGLTLFLSGKEITKKIWFPLIFLVFMFPIPEAMISLVSFPLKVFGAKAGVWITSLTRIPILLEGFSITIPNGHLLVGNPCSGLRSLIAFLALGSIFAYMATVSIPKKWLLFIISIPIALLSNIVRIPILILVSHYWGLEAASPDTLVHTGSGIFVFVLGFLFLLSFANILKWQT